MRVANVVKKCVVNILIVFTFGTIHVICLILNDFYLKRQKAVSVKNPYSIKFLPVLASRWQTLVYASQLLPW